MRPAGAERVQRPLRVHLISPAAAIQSGGRLPGAKAAAQQRPECRRLGRTAASRDRTAAEAGQGSRIPGRRGLCQAGGLRGAGTAWREVRDSHPGQRQPGEGHRGIADPSGGVPKPKASGLVQEFPVPGICRSAGPTTSSGGAKLVYRSRSDSRPNPRSQQPRSDRPWQRRCHLAWCWPMPATVSMGNFALR